MSQAKDLARIYGLVFGNLMIVISIQYFIAFLLEPTYQEDLASLYLAHFCVMVALLIGILLVALFLRRNIVPFFWVDTHQMAQAMRVSPDLWPPGYGPRNPIHGRSPPGYGQRAPSHGPSPGSQAGTAPSYTPGASGAYPEAYPEAYPPHVHPTTRPSGFATPQSYRPLDTTTSPQAGPARDPTEKETNRRSGLPPESPPPAPAPEEGPHYLRYNRSLHYAPQYHGPRYYQSRYQDQVANLRPAYYRSGVYGPTQTEVRPLTEAPSRRRRSPPSTLPPDAQRLPTSWQPAPGPRGHQASPLPKPSSMPGDSQAVPYRKGPLLGLEIREALHLPAFRYLFAIFVLSLVAGFLILQQDRLMIKAVGFPLAFIIAFSFPSLMWISFIYNRTQERPAPQRMIFIALSWGMLSTIPAMIFNTVGAYMLGADLNLLLEEQPLGPAEFATVALIAPMVEELFKPLGLLLIFRRLESGYSGVLYGVTCGMGFALVENMSYELLVLVGSDVDTVWTATSFVRGVGSTLLHAVGPALVGYYMACARFKGCDRHMVFVAYLMAMLLHGSWNSAASLGQLFPEVGRISTLSLLAILSVFIACLLVLRALLSISLTQQVAMAARPPHLRGGRRPPPPRQPLFTSRPPTPPPRNWPPPGFHPPPSRGSLSTGPPPEASAMAGRSR